MTKLPRVIAPFCLFLSIFAFAQEEIELPPIEMKATPIDWLLDDEVRPKDKRNSTKASASGALVRDVEHTHSLPTKDSGEAGAAKQITGLGKSAEEFGVQTLGVSLNPPHGGGFDFSSFPQYLWSGYTFTSGPSLAVFDPRVTSGVLALEPWTYATLGDSVRRIRASQLLSNNDLFQSAAAYSSGSESILAGYSFGGLEGVSGSAGIRRHFGESWTFDFHLLATHVTAHPKGTRSFPTPLATQRTSRGIPFVRAAHQFGLREAVNISAFHDQGFFRYDNGDTQTRDRTRQSGADVALILQDFRLGLSGRHIEFDQLHFTPPSENAWTFLASQRSRLGTWTVEPTLQLSIVSGFDLGLGGAIGVRKDLESVPVALYTRADFTRRYPSLSNRFYSAPGGVPNVGLLPEEIFSLHVGTEWALSSWKMGLEFVSQRREQAQVSVEVSPFTYQVQNIGNASLYSVEHKLEYRGLDWITIENRLRWLDSYVDQKLGPFPGSSVWTNILGLRTEFGDRWTAGSYVRGVSPIANNAYTGRLHGYWVWDAQLGAKIFREGGLSAQIVLENVLDTPIQVADDFLDRRRVIALTITGEI